MSIYIRFRVSSYELGECRKTAAVRSSCCGCPFAYVSTYENSVPKISCGDFSRQSTHRSGTQPNRRPPAEFPSSRIPCSEKVPAEFHTAPNRRSPYSQMKQPMHSRARNAHHPSLGIQMGVLHRCVSHCHVLQQHSLIQLREHYTRCRSCFCALRAVFPTASAAKSAA